MSEVTPQALSIVPTPPTAKTSTQLVVGLALVVPALILLCVSYVVPVLWVFRSSVSSGVIIPVRDGPAAGGGFTFDNFGDLFEGRFGTDVVAAFAFAAIPITTVLVISPLLAWAAHRGGTVTRWITRGVLAVPVAAYAPAAVIAAGILDHGIDRTMFVYWGGTFGLLAAIAVTAYLAALRRREPGRRPWGALAVAGGIGVAAVVCAALQEFSYSSVIVGRASAPPLGRLYVTAVQRFDFGPAVAGAALILIPVLLLGAGATVLMVLTGLRLEFDPARGSADEPSGWPTGRRVGAILCGVALLLVLAGTAVGLGPQFLHFFDDGVTPAEGADVWVKTWIPPLLSTLVGVLAAAAAAFGIAWIRPFGPRSEWLLLPFGLFLFVGLGPLALSYLAGQSDNRTDPTFADLVPPWWVAVPALFVLTLLLRGQALRRDALRQLGRPAPTARLLLPVLPMLGIVFLATWIAQAQDVGWSLLIRPGSGEELLNAPIAMLVAMRYGTVPVNLVLPVAWFVALLLLVVAAQLAYLDRIALRVGRLDRDPQPFG